MILRQFIFLAVFIVLAQTAAAEKIEDAPDCLNVSDCISILREHQIKPPPPPDRRLSSGIDPRPIEKAVDRLVSFGDEAVVALIKLFDHPNYYVRNRAAYTLFHFSKIDPRHLPALITAHRSGIHWLEPAIAATGSDEALRFLWEVFLEDPDQGSNSQTFRVLPEFGERLHPYVKAELAKCRTSDNYDLCSALLQLLQAYDPFPAYAVPILETIAISQAASEGVRRTAVSQLIALKHPFGLVALEDDLKRALTWLNNHPMTGLYYSGYGDEDEDDYYFPWFAEDTLQALTIYGEEAKELGPLVTPFLARRDFRDVRAQAALTLAHIGFSNGVDALLKTHDDLEDDWYLAYNVVESLGRLRAQSARDFVEELAQNHWYKPVRNNAHRALNYINGGDFARSEIENDGAPIDDNELWPLTGAEFRYQGDFSDTPSACASIRQRTYKLYMPPRLRWPDQQDGNVRLEFIPPTTAEKRTIFSTYPVLQEFRGQLVFAIEFGNQIVAGLDAGEFGGEVYTMSKNGQVSLLIPDNAIAAFKTEATLFVTTGLSHLVMSTGDLWVVDLEQDTPVLKRRIRLPLEPQTHELAFQQTLVIKSERGDVAITSDGKLIDPMRVRECLAKNSSDFLGSDNL